MLGTVSRLMLVLDSQRVGIPTKLKLLLTARAYGLSSRSLVRKGFTILIIQILRKNLGIFSNFLNFKIFYSNAAWRKSWPKASFWGGQVGFVKNHVTFFAAMDSPFKWQKKYASIPWWVKRWVIFQRQIFTVYLDKWHEEYIFCSDGFAV